MKHVKFIGFLVTGFSGCIHFPGPRNPLGRIDPVEICCSDNAPIHPGVSRAHVHELLKGEGMPGKLGGAVETYYFLVQSGHDLLIGPSPEGGFVNSIGHNLSYRMTIEYGDDDLVKQCKVIEESPAGDGS